MYICRGKKLICPENINFLNKKQRDYKNYEKLNSILFKVLIFGGKSIRVIVESVVATVFKVKDTKIR